MTDLRTAAQQALEALELVTDLTNHDDEIYGAIDALRAALVEPEQDRALQWGAAPARIEFGSSPNCWREAFLPLGKDNTLRLLAETEALPLVENALRAALARQAEPTGKKSLQVESVVAENATTQQQIEQTPPSDYRRGYWDGFLIGKREGRIEAEDAAKQAEPVEQMPVGWLESPHGAFRADPLYKMQFPSQLLQWQIALYTAPPQQAEPDAYGYALRLAVAIWEKHYKDVAPQWKPLDDLMGVLTQIDNMTSGLTRLAQQAEPVEPVAKCIDDICSEHFGRVEAFDYLPRDTLLYTAPPQRKPLSEEEIGRLCDEVSWSPRQLARAVERAHGITGDPK